MLNSIISASYDDDFDGLFDTSNDSKTSTPTHEDWKGLPWDDEPINETTSATDDEDDWANFDTDDDQTGSLPITKMPDITPEEIEICKVLNRNSGYECDTADNNNDCNNDANGDVFDDDDMTLFDDNPPPSDDYSGGDSDTVSSAKTAKKKCPKFVVEVKNENGDIEKVFIDRNELLKHVLDQNKVMVIQNHTTNMVMLYAYIDGRYVYLTDVSVERMVAKYIIDYEIDLLKMSDVNDVTHKLTIVAPEESLDKINADENIINFKNGVLNISTGDI